MKRSLPVLVILLAVGCAPQETNPPTPVPIPSAATPSAAASTPAPAPEPAVPQPCADDDLAITGDQPEGAGTTRRAVVSFTNTSADMCTLVGYPVADLVTAAGGVLVHVARRPANAAPRLELQPGEVATADVEASAVDTSTGAACGRTGTLVVTAPGTIAPHTLPVNLPICEATTSAVG
jgi:hypothetical protein